MANVHLIAYKTIFIVAVVMLSAGLQLIYVRKPRLTYIGHIVTMNFNFQFNAQIVASQFSLIIIVAILRIVTYASTIDEMKELVRNFSYRCDCANQ